MVVVAIGAAAFFAAVNLLFYIYKMSTIIHCSLLSDGSVCFLPLINLCEFIQIEIV